MSDDNNDRAINHDDGQLGWIVSWKVPAQISLEHLYQALTAAGLDLALAGDMRNEHALRRALRDMNESRVIRKLRREEGHVYFQFTHEFLGEREIHYNREAELCLNTETGVVTADVGEIATQAQLLLNEHLGKRMTSDLTRLVQRIYEAAKADLIPIREQGFAYFVPATHDELVEKSRQFLDAIGGKLRSFAVRLGSAETSASVAESMADYFLDMVHEFRETCAGLSLESRVDVRGRRLAAIGEMRSKLECYRGLLAGLAERITGEITDAERALLEALSRPAPSDDDASAASLAETLATTGMAALAL